MFENRTDAGMQLAQKLLAYENEQVVVMAIPRGGLPLGAIVASTLDAPLDVALTKKIGHPANKEFAIGAVSLENRFTTDTIDVSTHYIDEETERIRAILWRRHNQYYKNCKPQELRNKIVIIVDDGIATGNTILATIQLVQKTKPSKIIVAIPVAPLSAVEKLSNSPHVDDVICLATPENFRAVGQFYQEFYPVTDEMAIQILEECNKC